MTQKQRWVAWLLFGFALLAVLGMGVSAYMFSRWSELKTVSAQEADREFARAAVEAGEGPPYLEISPEGTVSVRRELERSVRTSLSTLHFLAWGPDQKGLLRVDFPFWFVRLKMSDSLNLGTITSLLAHDWGNLNLKVSIEELERRGPGLVLDHKLADGRRILLWTEAESAQ